MAQHDYIISNQSFPNTRQDLNNSLSAVVSNNSGASEPTTTYAYQWWYDSTNDILKMRNADNDAWITMFTFNQTTDTYSLATDVELTLTENLDLTGSATISGNIGINQASPSARLEIVATAATSGEDLIKLSNGADACELVIDTSANAVNFKTGSGDDLVFLPAGTERVRIDASNGHLGIGETTPAQRVHIKNTGTGSVRIRIENDEGYGEVSTDGDGIQLRTQAGIVFDSVNGSHTYLRSGDGVEKMRITSTGGVLINTTSEALGGGINFRDVGVTGSANEDGFGIHGTDSVIYQQTNGSNAMFMNDSSSTAGTHNYIVFRYQGGTIGDIDTTDNSLIRYNTFTGGHWSQFHDGTNPELKTGTIMSLTGDKLEYSKCEKTVTKEDGIEQLQKFEIAGTHEIGTEVTVPNDEYGEEDLTTTATVVSNYIADHLVKVKVSDIVADKAVYGVWAGKYNDGDLSVEALGTSKIRIKAGEVLEVGDLLESAGDGTAQKQSDDIIKNSTIAKVTSPIVIETFDDNSFLVSCVLYCG